MGKPKVKAPQSKSKRRVVLKKQKSPAPAVNQENQTKPSPFSSLPNEMVEHILNMLPIQDKKSARLVSPHWYQVLNRSVVLKIPLNTETILELRRRPYAINELEVVLNRVSIPPAFAFTKTMKESFLTTKILNFMADDYYYLYGLIRLHRNNLDGAGVMALIKACRNMHTLKFNFRFMESYTMTDTIRLNNIQLECLRTLELKLAYGGQQEVSHTLLQMVTPQLQNLEVERFKYDTGKGSSADWKIYLALMRFMGRNKATLKSLKLVNMLTNITLARYPLTEFPADMLSDLGQLRLESLEIQHSDSRLLREDYDIEDWPAANQIMDQLSLKVLKLHMASADIIQKSYIVIANCRDTLTNLDLNVKEADVEFNLNTLRQLKCLTNLTFTSKHLVDAVLPRTIKYLTWNAPVHPGWYSLNLPSTLFPALLKLKIGHQSQYPFRLVEFCYAWFGISPFTGFSSSTRTKLQLMTIGRKLHTDTRPTLETRSQFQRRNMDVAAALRLPKHIFHVVHDTENIRIGIQSGIPI